MKNKYLNDEIKDSIAEKGFSVYNYISLNELLSTIQRDYLRLMVKINIFFAISSIFIWFFTFDSAPSIFIWFLLLVYWVIFLYLLVLFIIRSYYFVFISDIVYTSKWIILWRELYDLENLEKLDSKLLIYERHFDEYLSQESKLWQIINKNKQKLVSEVFNWGKKILDKSKWSKDPRIFIVLFLFYSIYSVFLFLAYYIWLLLGFLFFVLLIWLLKIILFFRKNTELKIKYRVESIEKTFLKMEKIYTLINNKILSFKWWNISDISWFIESNFESFYSRVLYVLDERIKLLSLIKESKYKEFINFKTLENYIIKNFNKPINEMISLLDNYEKTLNKWLIDLSKIISDKVENTSNLSYKKIILENQLNILKLNRERLKKSLMKN